jgi:hypothetical protein
MWVSEFTKNSATVKGGSAELFPGLNRKLCDLARGVWWCVAIRILKADA